MSRLVERYFTTVEELHDSKISSPADSSAAPRSMTTCVETRLSSNMRVNYWDESNTGDVHSRLIQDMGQTSTRGIFP